MARLLSKEENRTFMDISDLRDFNSLQEQSYKWVEFDTSH